MILGVGRLDVDRLPGNGDGLRGCGELDYGRMICTRAWGHEGEHRPMPVDDAIAAESARIVSLTPYHVEWKHPRHLLESFYFETDWDIL